MVPDTHAHLDAAAFSEDIEAVVVRACEAGIGRILAVGSDLASSLRALELAETHAPIYAAVGIHPHEAAKFEAEAEEICSLLAAEKVVAVGEIGLDYRRSDNRAQQIHAYSTQLAWAAEAGLPVSVHNREANEDMLDGIRRFGVLGVLHCFSGDADLAARALETGCYLSFAGNVTFPNAGELRTVAADLPEDRILIESDSPVLAPQPWRGRRNEPAYVVATAEALAKVRDTSFLALTARLAGNANTVFSWSTGD